MPLRQKIAMLIVCIFVFMFILNLVRQRKLREEYSWLWLFTAVALFALVIKYDWLVFLTRLIGAGLPTSTLLIGSMIFMIVLCVQFSVRISRLTDQVKNLIQENALLRASIDDIREQH